MRNSIDTIDISDTTSGYISPQYSHGLLPSALVGDVVDDDANTETQSIHRLSSVSSTENSVKRSSMYTPSGSVIVHEHRENGGRVDGKCGVEMLPWVAVRESSFPHSDLQLRVDVQSIIL